MKKKIFNALYQSNDAYAMVSGISIVSLLENNQHMDEVNIFYCDYEITKASRAKLQKIVDGYKNAHLQFIDAKGYHKTLGELKVKPWHGFYITWLKMLAFGDLKLKTDRVMFINGHTIINGALDELLELDFEDNIMALSYDCLLNEHKRTIGLKETDGYYNCGLMLVNHKKWLKENIDQVLKDHLTEKSDYVIADQDLCNVLFKGKIKTIGATYNFSSAYYAYDLKRLLKINDLKPSYFYSYEEIMEDYYSPKIIHSLFGIKGKPWEEGNDHPQRYLWEKYIRMTPWKNAKRPAAVHTRNWTLYETLPNWAFMQLYRVAVRKKFGDV
jgi:lipopolysaccharide biosynthesis glycosyltransferase